MAPPRILLCGDVLGRLPQLYKRVLTVNKSAGPFDALFCVGQFFPDAPELLEVFLEYTEGRIEIPIPTYFVGDYGVGGPKVLSRASKENEQGGFKLDGLKICHNLYWLKGSGKFTLQRLSVAYLSGKQSSVGQQFGTYGEDDVAALRALAEESDIVDLFLTNEWPVGVTNRAAPSDIPPGISDTSGSDSTVSELAAEIKPRYHIAGTMGVFYAREPYSNSDSSHVTRFLGLAPVGNKEKKKFLHAISPTPASTMSPSEINAKPPNTTLSPYMNTDQKSIINESMKRPGDGVSDTQYWRYDVSQKRQKVEGRDGEMLCFKFVSSGTCPRGEKCHFRHDMDAREHSLRGVCFDFLNKGKCERGPDCNFRHSLQDDGEGYSKRRPGNSGANRSKECWFCLSNPNIESHLIVSIGEVFYCALPKGPLVQDHALIVPIEHLSNTLAIPSEGESELDKFQMSLKMYHKTQGMDVVFFEWIYRRGSHANLQAVPIPSSRASAVKNIFSLAAEKLGFEFAVIESRKSLRAQFNTELSMFYVELPDGAILSHIVEENEKFSAQFGREVLAGLLNMADKADWKKSSVSKDEEVLVAEGFKNRFGKFNPYE